MQKRIGKWIIAPCLAISGLLVAGHAGAQQLSGAQIANFTAVDGTGAANPGCGGSLVGGGGAGNLLTGALNTVLGTPGFDDEGVTLNNRRDAFRYCDSLTTTGANGWTGDAAAIPAALAQAQATALAPEEIFAGMDNAHAAFDLQTGNVAKRLSLVRLARRIDQDRDEAIALRGTLDRTSPGQMGAIANADQAIDRRGFARLSQEEEANQALLALQQGINAGDGSEGEGLGFFLNGRVNAIKGEQNNFERGSDGFGGGFTLGFDKALGDEMFAGVAMGYTHIETNFDGSSSEADLDAVTFTGYGAFFPEDALYIDGSASISYLGFDQSNDLLVFDGGNPLGTLRGEADGVNVGFDVGAGYTFDVSEWGDDERLKGLTIEPTARLSFLYTYIEDFVQGGGDGSLNLSIDDQETISVTASVGFRTEYPISTRYGVITPYVRAAYVHEFNNENDDLDIGIAALGGPTVNLRAEATDSHYGDFGVGAAATLSEGLSQFVDYDVIAGHDNVTIHQITAGMRLEF